jgi:hypothetical protein
MALSKDDIEKVIESLSECHPPVEVFNWGPTLEFAKSRRDHALKLLHKELRTLLKAPK